MIRLIVQTDGTGQDGNDAITNVARLNDFLVDGEDNQYCSYSPGVGTSIGEELDGGIAGAHLEKVVNHQYSWLSRCIDSLKLTKEDNFEVELFGFSRGAFISRLLADILYRCGIPKNPKDATAIVKLYKKKAWGKMDTMTKIHPEDFLKARIGFLGCWDTVVTSLGYKGADYELVPGNVVMAAHAVAINESRPKFNYTKMHLRKGIREEFFAGCHSDVGGGYGIDQVLSRIALEWMIEQAENAGVLFRARPDPIGVDEYDKADVHSEHKSASNLWGGLGFLTRKIERSRINQSVSLLPWNLFDSEGLPLNSEQMVASAQNYHDTVRTDGTIIA